MVRCARRWPIRRSNKHHQGQEKDCVSLGAEKPEVAAAEVRSRFRVALLVQARFASNPVGLGLDIPHACALERIASCHDDIRTPR